ncbi:MAG: hypothetical protein JSV04_00870 [Candidatus Heimdallarchaeota archaeon]|nr:MAG: hypothetical protein JSV04_00870 [Candidatus Heimdallarchaeota archaeon]
MNTITTRIDDDDRALLEWLVNQKRLNKSELVRTMLKDRLREEALDYCFQQYIQGEMTLLRIAQITGLSLIDILIHARLKKIIYQYSIEDLEQDLQTINNLV